MKFGLNDLFSNKMLLQVYFLFFIFLNIIDFLNIIAGDFDFFKKILSWTIIGYVFYKVSLSKVFIGQRLKSYDLGFILSFCFFTIPKSLVLYVSNIKVNDVIPNDFFVFGSFLRYIDSFDVQFFLTLTFFFGLVSSLVLSISILLNYDIRRKSFLGSFNFKNNYFKYFLEQVLLSFVIIFFGVIIFNFFMEWFALAVDSIILVVGLFYYLFIYIHNHGRGKASYILRNVANAGNSFYLNLIGMFSNKKTIFVGISFLLALHLLVDIGVYLVPYTIGTENTLYFDSLNTAGRDHIPLFFNLGDLSNSQIVKDLSSSKGIDSFIALGVVLVYVISLFGFFVLMFLPFYIFYKNTQNKKIRFKPWVAILIISCLFFMFCFNFFSYFGVFNSNLNLPIGLDKPILGSNVKGVDIYTSPIFNLQGIEVTDFVQFMVSILFFFTAMIFLLFKYEKYKFYFDKLILLVVLIFFVYYIFIFYVSSVESEMNSFKSKFDRVESNFEEYQKALSIYEDEEFFVFPGTLIYENDAGTFKARVYAFSDLKKMAQRTVEYKEVHNDYLFFEVENVDFSRSVLFYDYNKVYFDNGVYDKKDGRFLSENLNFIYFLGENYFSLDEVAEGEYMVDLNIREDTIDSWIFFPSIFEVSIEKIFGAIEYLRLVLISIFYIFGGIGFVVFYFKRNILNLN